MWQNVQLGSALVNRMEFLTIGHVLQPPLRYSICVGEIMSLNVYLL